jgi:hypothetical protein
MNFSEGTTANITNFNNCMTLRGEAKAILCRLLSTYLEIPITFIAFRRFISRNANYSYSKD